MTASELQAWVAVWCEFVAAIAQWTRNSRIRPTKAMTKRQRVTARRLPLAPLLPFLEVAALELMHVEGDRGGRQHDRPNHCAMARRVGTSANQLYRWLRYGVTPDQADELAVALGLHPLNVWPDWS